MFQYCPCCASRNIQFIEQRKFSCPDCGYVYYHNIAAATGCIISTGTHILFLVRGKNPGAGKLTIPGGFVSPGEGALEGMIRECQEEIGWVPPGNRTEETGGKAGKSKKSKAQAFSFFASFPNIYPYKGVTYNTCDIFFTVNAPELRKEDLTIDPKEVQELRFIRPQDVDYDEFAFDSTRRVLRAYIASLDSLQK